jgi:hypothetical protein
LRLADPALEILYSRVGRSFNWSTALRKWTVEKRIGRRRKDKL